MTAAKAHRTVYSYRRYSHPSQGSGDSIRRQTAEAEAWCKRNGGQLDLAKQMEDRGYSASTGANILNGALGQFLEEVKARAILPGSVLILENLDRMSREHPWVSLPILCELVNAGITVVTLSPREMTYEAGCDPSALFTALVELIRSHQESERKGDAVRKAWLQLKAAARATGAVMTTQRPAWLELLDGKFVPIPERVAAVRRVFDLAAAGHGMKMICRQLDAEGLAPFGRSGRWAKSYVFRILKGREVLGEYQPRGVEARQGRGKKNRVAEGDPVAGYYPAVVDQTTWDRAQAAIAGRVLGGRPKGGRVGRVPDLFSGMLWDAGHGCRMLTMDQVGGLAGRRQKRRVLAPAEANQGRVPFVTFPYPVFERCILAKLKEVTAAEVLGAEPEGESAKLAAQKTTVELRLKQLRAELVGDAGDVRELVEAASALNDKLKNITRRLAEARGREANPRAEALAEMQTLIDVAADPHGRLRLRSLLRTVLDSVHVLIVRRKGRWLVAAQVNFAGGGWRSYFIRYQPAGNGRKEFSDVEAFKLAGALLDLRRKADAAKMRRVLDNVHDGLTAGAVMPAL